MSTALTLQEAADELGVHYMTAYRYVRHGLLHAEKVSGAWQVDRSSLERFRSGEGAPVEPGDRAPWAERLEGRLVAGDAAGSWGVVEGALAAGADLDSLYLDVIAPAMVSIGERWAVGDIDIAVEHVASGIITRMIGRLGHRFTRRGRSRGGVVLGAPAGEAHALPSTMLGDLLRLRGWEVSDLGANVPAGSFVHAVRTMPGVVAVGVSVTYSSSLGAVAEACAALHAECPTVRIILGGRAVTGVDQAVELGAHGWAKTGAEADVLLRRWSREQERVVAGH